MSSFSLISSDLNEIERNNKELPYRVKSYETYKMLPGEQEYSGYNILDNKCSARATVLGSSLIISNF